MALSRIWLVGAVTLAFVFQTLVPAHAASRLSEKNIIKKLTIKKAKPVKRRVQRKRNIKLKSTKRTLTTRSLTVKPKNSLVVRRKKLKIRKNRALDVVISKTKEKSRSLTRRKTLRRLLSKNRSRSKSRTIQKRSIAFPAPAIEIAEGGNGGGDLPAGGDRPRPPKNTGGQGGKTSGGTKWVSSSPKPAKTWNGKSWKKKTVRYTTTASRQQVQHRVTEPAQLATTRYERDQIQEIVQTEGLPQIDIEIYFDYNSASIRPQSMPDIGTLGRALRNKQLAGSQFMIIGHTDASGSDSYNLQLSEARANAVRDFLVNIFGLEGERFFSMGYGEEQLKRPDYPEHAVNRRVQIVNIGGQAVAEVADDVEDSVPDDQ